MAAMTLTAPFANTVPNTLPDTLPLQQSPAFVAALTASGAAVTHTDPVVVQRSFWGKARIGFASRGPLDTSDLRALRRQGLHVFNAEHDRPDIYKAAGYRQIISPAHVAEWDLSGTDAQRLGGLHPKWRNQLRRAQSANLRVREMAWDGSDHIMFPHADALARKRKYRPLPSAFIALLARLTPDTALIFEAYDKGQLVAAILTLRHGPSATYQCAWTTPLGRLNHAHNLLLYAAANRLAALGHRTFDLGLVETDHTPNLARFKLRTGATLRALGGTWIAIPGL